MQNSLFSGTIGYRQACRPDRAPTDLALRLADALQYGNCSPDALWDEISEWLGANHVAPLIFLSDQLLLWVPESAKRYAKYQPVSQAGSTMNLTRLIYSSHHAGLDAAALDQILRKSRDNNAHDHITGALIVSENGFMQVLEGTRTAVGHCFVRIMKDRHHDNIQVISCGDASQRLFFQWDMHLIPASQIKRDIMSHYLINGTFNPEKMSEFAIADLCRTLSEGGWEAEAA